MLIIISTLIGCSSLIHPIIVSMIIRLFIFESKNEKKLMKEIVEKKIEAKGISMVDQFVAYAKLQRKINTLQEQYKENASARLGQLKQKQAIVGGLLRGFTMICYLVMLWYYRSSPVLALPPTLLWPLSPLMALPSCELGEISVIVWLAVVRTVCSRLPNILQSVGIFRTKKNPAGDIGMPPTSSALGL